jgi:CRP-like cAMP-binding protein
VFGPPEAFDDGRPGPAATSWTVTTLTACELLLISRPGLAELGARRAQAQVWAGMGARIHQLETRLAGALAADVPVRLAITLLDLADRFGCRTEEGIQVDLALSQADLAGLVGSSRETVNRSLTTFRERGWIAPSRRGDRAIALLDERGLRSFVEASA